MDAQIRVKGSGWRRERERAQRVIVNNLQSLERGVFFEENWYILHLQRMHARLFWNKYVFFNEE